MKHIVGLLLICFSFFGFSQIQFEHGTLEEALALAKKQNKPLFVDVYAVWCGPCKMMASTAFVDKDVAELYNSKFINLKLDGEKNDGPMVMQHFGLSAYPTLLYFNPDGTLAAKVVGAMQAKQLIQKGKEVLDPESNPVYVASKKFHKSSKKLQDLENYLDVLIQNESDSIAQYAYLYYGMNTKLDLRDPVHLTVFKYAIHDYKHPLSQEFITNDYFKTNKDEYLNKMNDYFKTTYEQAKMANDFEIMHQMVLELYPQLQKCGIPDLPPMENYLERVKSQF